MSRCFQPFLQRWMRLKSTDSLKVCASSASRGVLPSSSEFAMNATRVPLKGFSVFIMIQFRYWMYLFFFINIILSLWHYVCCVSRQRGVAAHDLQTEQVTDIQWQVVTQDVHVDARCEHKYLEPSTCDQITRDALISSPLVQKCLHSYTILRCSLLVCACLVLYRN